VKYLRVLGSKCYIKRDEDLWKLNTRSDEGIFLGYSTQSKAYRCFNKRLKKIVESVNARVDETKEKSFKSCRYDLDEQDENQNQGRQVQT